VVDRQHVLERPDRAGRVAGLDRDRRDQRVRIVLAGRPRQQLRRALERLDGRSSVPGFLLLDAELHLDTEALGVGRGQRLQFIE
jgi:hypothetical protein